MNCERVEWEDQDLPIVHVFSYMQRFVEVNAITSHIVSYTAALKYIIIIIPNLVYNLPDLPKSQIQWYTDKEHSIFEVIYHKDESSHHTYLLDKIQITSLTPMKEYNMSMTRQI